MAAVPTASPLSTRERYAGVLYGALAADSLALGAHWIYEQDQIESKFGRVKELHPPTRNDYHPEKEHGTQSHYGDQTLVLLDSLEACGGNFVMEDFARRWREFWSDTKSYRDKATKATLANLEKGVGLTRAGSESTDLAGAARIAPILVALRNEEKPTIIAAVRAQTALTHATPTVIDTAEFIAHTVFALMRGVSVASALQMSASLPYRALKAEAILQQAEAVRQLPTVEAVDKLGQACPLEQSLPSVFAILLRDGGDLELALEENVMAGGDSAARGLVLGMILGAAYGRRAVPERWIAPLKSRPKIEAFLQTVGLGGMD
jgi:ADP-ribosylglycohydrolase